MRLFSSRGESVVNFIIQLKATSMLTKTSLALAGALSAAAILAAPTSAFPHAVCGSRIFPATLGIDDPGVQDELTPTLRYLPSNSDGSQEFDAGLSWSKTIIPNVGVVISDGATWLRPGGAGRDPLNTEL